MSNANAASPFTVKPDGTICVPAFELPLSAALSDEAASRQAAAYNNAAGISMPNLDHAETEEDYQSIVDMFRHGVDAMFAVPLVERILSQFPVRMTASEIAGVSVEEFTPLDGHNPDHVLINLHGGGFYSGQKHIARVESIPVAHLGKYRVISVDYRQGYEHKFPAATKDVVDVFSELLKSYPAERIGLYGGSAGGTLTLQTTAWLAQTGQPVPGAIGVFGAGADGRGDGDYFSAIGTMQKPPLNAFRLRGTRFGYFSGVDAEDPMVNPLLGGKELLSKFPPSLFITGSRAFDFSAAIATQRALLQAGADAELHVFDGHGHCFYYDTAVPESLDAYNMILRFFGRHLACSSVSACSG
jgi:epsilon-lactone hydrolase